MTGPPPARSAGGATAPPGPASGKGAPKPELAPVPAPVDEEDSPKLELAPSPVAVLSEPVEPVVGVVVEDPVVDPEPKLLPPEEGAPNDELAPLLLPELSPALLPPKSSWARPLWIKHVPARRAANHCRRERIMKWGLTK